MADAAGCQVGCGRATDTANTNKQHGAGSDSLLTIAADLLESKVAGIAAQHFRLTRLWRLR